MSGRRSVPSAIGSLWVLPICLFDVTLLLGAPAARSAGTPPVFRNQAAGQATAAGKAAPMDDLQSCILKHWVHSHEEDAGGVTVYRPAGYAFAPSRGRRGLEFRKDGALVYHGIARADGSEPLSGRWSLEGSDRLKITVDDPRIEPFVLQVVSCDAQLLKVRSA